MGEVNYKQIIQDMTWSYSRIKSFNDCPYRWFLKYIQPILLIHSVFGGERPSKADIDAAYVRGEVEKADVGILYAYLGIKRKDMFFANYGTFMHKLIELYYRGEKTPRQLCDMYLQEFKGQVSGRAPNRTVFTNYFKSGINYLRGFQPFPYNTVAVEKRVDFSLNGIPFVGYIDYLGERDGDFAVIDNKSRVLKPRSKRAKPTKTDEELDSYLIQLYLYSVAVEQDFHKLPKELCFNCFRTPILITEPFEEEAYTASKLWLSDKVSEIMKETEFRPSIEFFKCKHLCEMQDFCEYCELAGKG